MTRKVLFVGIGLLRDERLLWAVYLAATCLALALQAKLQPFESEAANRVETSFLLVQTITLTLGGVFTFELVDTSSLLAKVVSFVLILINFYTLCPLLVSAVPSCGGAVVTILTRCARSLGAARATEARAHRPSRPQQCVPQVDSVLCKVRWLRQPSKCCEHTLANRR